MRTPLPWTSLLLTAWVLAFCVAGTTTASAEPPTRPSEITEVQGEWAHH